MPSEVSAGKPTTRRYSEQEKAAAVRMVRSLRAELGTSQNTRVQGRDAAGLQGRVRTQLGQAGRH